MELRYMGFDQTRGTRVYRFDCVETGQPLTRHNVSVEMRLFLEYRVGIQEGPALCARKVTAGLEAQCGELAHELTEQDMVAYTGERAAAEARKAESRNFAPHRRAPSAAGAPSPWRR
jgi:hypothetical protein